MSAYNPYIYLPVDVCGDESIPVFDAIQDCASYEQLRSEVCGLLALPFAGTPPGSWQTIAGWASLIDNTDTSGTKAKYLVGRGSFLPASVTTVSLAGGRLEENRERSQRLSFNVLNMDSGHVTFGRKLQTNNRAFNFWLQTIGGRIIGGAKGMRPFFSDAVFPFADGSNSREAMTVILDAWFLDFPQW